MKITKITKKTITGTVRPEQKSWLEFVNKSGGIAIIARPGDDVVNILKNWKA